MKYFHMDFTPSKLLVVGFAVIIFVGATLLSLPIATEDGEGIAFIDALFTATSATCVTGLVVVDTGDTFSLFGEIVILSLIQIGGIGFMTFATFLFTLTRKKVSFKELLLLKEALNAITTEGIILLVKRILVFTLVIETVGAVVLAIRFSLDMPISKAIYYGAFHAISMFNNAGFDLMGQFNSLTSYVDDPIVVFTVCLLIIFGGLGFIVMNELFEYRHTKRLSVHSKIILSSTIFLVFGASIVIFLLEINNEKTLGTLSAEGKFLATFFHSVTPRTAGANTLGLGDLTDATLFFTIFLMFIGGGSGSTAGGIKLSTFVILIVTVLSQFKGKEEVEIFRYRIGVETIFKALAVAISGMAIIVFVTLLLSITEGGNDFLRYLFEATSAFGTVGLSIGLTPELSNIGRLLIIMTMFIGRVGPLTLGIAITRKKKKEAIRHVKGNIMIG